MKRGPQLVAAFGVALTTWLSIYLFVPLAPAVQAVVEAVRLLECAPAEAHIFVPAAHLMLECVCADSVHCIDLVWLLLPRHHFHQHAHLPRVPRGRSGAP